MSRLTTFLSSFLFYCITVIIIIHLCSLIFAIAGNKAIVHVKNTQMLAGLTVAQQLPQTKSNPLAKLRV